MPHTTYHSRPEVGSVLFPVIVSGASATSSRSPRAAAGLALVTLLLGLSACSPFNRANSYRPENAFIGGYSPRPEGSTAPRLAVKDLIDLKGTKTTAGSRYLARHAAPATEDAPLMAGARASGAWIVGKVNLGEFALGVSGVNDHFGTPLNPIEPRRRFVPGGSSSGSASAVATGLADISYGSDTAGSIRVPAASCGVVGLKTTHGLVPLEGVFPISPDVLDTVGPIARDTRWLARGTDMLIPGFQARYDREKARHPTGRTLTVGRLYVPGTAPAIDAAIDASLRAAGFRVVRLGDPFVDQWQQAESDGRIVAAASGWISDHRFLRKPGVSGTTKNALRIGRLAYNTNYREAIARRPAWQRALNDQFRRVDLIATPVLKGAPPRLSMFIRTGLLELRMFERQNTVAVNLAGNPAVAVPIPMVNADATDPLTSLQLVGPRLSEARLVNAARIVEKTSPTPPLPEFPVIARAR